MAELLFSWFIYCCLAGLFTVYLNFAFHKNEAFDDQTLNVVQKQDCNIFKFGPLHMNKCMYRDVCPCAMMCQCVWKTIDDRSMDVGDDSMYLYGQVADI